MDATKRERVCVCIGCALLVVPRPLVTLSGIAVRIRMRSVNTVFESIRWFDIISSMKVHELRACISLSMSSSISIFGGGVAGKNEAAEAHDLGCAAP